MSLSVRGMRYEVSRIEERFDLFFLLSFLFPAGVGVERPRERERERGDVAAGVPSRPESVNRARPGRRRGRRRPRSPLLIQHNPDNCTPLPLGLPSSRLWTSYPSCLHPRQVRYVCYVVLCYVMCPFGLDHHPAPPTPQKLAAAARPTCRARTCMDSTLVCMYVCMCVCMYVCIRVAIREQKGGGREGKK